MLKKCSGHKTHQHEKHQREVDELNKNLRELLNNNATQKIAISVLTDGKEALEKRVKSLLRQRKYWFSFGVISLWVFLIIVAVFTTK